MSRKDEGSRLFLLKSGSASQAKEAANRLREQGLIVVVRFGDVALEAKGSDLQVEAVTSTGLFSAVLSGPMHAEHMKKLTPEQARAVQIWNARFSSHYKKLVEDRSWVGKKWSDEGRKEPAPYSRIDADEFLDVVRRFEHENKKTLLPDDKSKRSGKQTAPKTMDREAFEEFRTKIQKRGEDEGWADDIARLAVRLGPRYHALFDKIPDELWEVLRRRFFGQAAEEASCWRLDGEISVGVVFVESSRSGGPKFSNSERDDICAEILAGHSWLTNEHPTGFLSWVYDFQFIKLDLADGDEGDCTGGISDIEPHWRDPAMAAVSFNGNSYSGDMSGVADYREDMRDAHNSAHAFVIFVTPYANCWHAYAGSRRIVLAKHDNWGGWGRGAINAIAAHETCHLFGSADEYTGSGTPCSSCTTTHGCDNIPNGNCGDCARPQQSCVMDGTDLRLCNYTRGQIGWGHLFVELETADVSLAGTDDDVWLDIGDRTFVLDTPDHDDRERNNREGYAFYEPNLSLSQIKRVMIRKSEDGAFGGWKLKRVRVWLHGDVICDESPNVWLEDDVRWWTGCVSDRDLVNTLKVKISTADVMWAGTDDDVTLTLAGRSWNLDNDWHDDFERGHTDTFNLNPLTGFRKSEIHSIRIHKSSDGVAGGWKLKGAKVIINGDSFYDNQSINKWLEDDDRTWSHTF